MTLYEINDKILECIDQETGEIINEEMLNELEMARDEKLESVALWIKDLKAENSALKAEEENLARRRKTNETKMESLKNWLKLALNGDKFKTTKCSVSYTTSHAVELTDQFVDNALLLGQDEYLTYSKPTANKTAIKEAIENGIVIDGAIIVERKAIVIK